jgi:hypothetical protein
LLWLNRCSGALGECLKPICKNISPAWDALDDALKQAIESIAQTDARGWFKHCGDARRQFDDRSGPSINHF